VRPVRRTRSPDPFPDSIAGLTMELGPAIVAVATPPGASLRGIVRMSGAGTGAVLREMMRDPEVVDRAAPTTPATPEVRAVVLTIPAGAVPALLITGSPPRTFTGEESAELLLPGNRMLLDRVVEAFLSSAKRIDVAARSATAGEFSARAYLNGRLTLDRAESIAIAVSAQHDEEIRAARLLAGGELGALARRWTDAAVEMLALTEAGIDFTDEEDVVAIAASEFARRARALASEIDAAISTSMRAERLSPVPIVVLAGPPNVGKSSLFNALLGAERAVANPHAGTTRDVLTALVRIERSTDEARGGIDVMLVDVAGEESVDDGDGDRLRVMAQRATRDAMSRGDLILRCVSSEASYCAVAASNVSERSIVVRTKADLHDRSDGVQVEDELRSTREIAVSAVDGRGLSALRSAIADALASTPPLADATLALTDRHDRLLRDAKEAFGDAAALVGDGDRSIEHPELVAASMRTAIDALGAITGRVVSDDILGAIFSRFCVGK